jgi:hypothetical protein
VAHGDPEGEAQATVGGAPGAGRERGLRWLPAPGWAPAWGWWRVGRRERRGEARGPSVKSYCNENQTMLVCFKLRWINFYVLRMET